MLVCQELLIRCEQVKFFLLVLDMLVPFCEEYDALNRVNVIDDCLEVQGRPVGWKKTVQRNFSFEVVVVAIILELKHIIVIIGSHCVAPNDTNE